MLEIVSSLQKEQASTISKQKAKMELVFCNFLVGKFIYKKVNDQQTNTSTES